jgi:hypothetical protein
MNRIERSVFAATAMWNTDGDGLSWRRKAELGE